MTCKETQSFMDGYFDRELDLVRSIDLERHLHDCPACAELHKSRMAVRGALGASDLRYQAPAALRASVRAKLAEAAPQPASQPQAEPELQTTYPDGYSHAHPTDSLGRPIEAPANDSIHEPAAVDSGQQDWVGGVTPADKPAQTTPAAAYAPSHERGT